MWDMIPLLLTLAAAGYLAWALRRPPGPRSVALGWLLIACPYLAFRLLTGDPDVWDFYATWWFVPALILVPAAVALSVRWCASRTAS